MDKKETKMAPVAPPPVSQVESAIVLASAGCGRWRLLKTLLD